MTKHLERLLRPRSIAAIGGLPAARVIENNQKIGFTGELWPVHPEKAEVHGLRAYASLDDLPGPPDAAYIAVNRERTIEQIEKLSAMGCGGAICYASGFRESDATGRELEAALIEAAGDMPVLGPNCYGLLNYADGALLWPDQHGGRRLAEGHTGAAIVAQSSNISSNFTMQQRGLPLAYVMTVGNQALVGMSDLALALLDDPHVTTLGLYVEGFDSVAGFERLAQKARALQKPVVVFKVGRTVQAQRSAKTHTASLVGAHSVTREFLRRNGFGQAHSIPVFLETLKLLHAYGPLDGYRVSSMSCSGGEASIIADAAERRKVYFPDLDDAQKAPLQQVLGPLVTIDNPLDYHTYSWAKRDILEGAYSAMTAIGFDMNYLILDFPHHARCDDSEWHIAVDAFDSALRKNRARGAFVVSMPENIPEAYIEDYAGRGIASLLGIDEALAATEIAADIGIAWRQALPAPVLPLPPLSRERITLDEASAKQSLRASGVPVPAGARIDSVDAALAQADAIGYPVVLKALGIAHKTEHNAVRLDLGDANALRGAAEALFQLSPTLYIERMHSVLVELIVGVTRDAQFGLVLTLGSGGVLVELIRDSETLIMPATREQIEVALDGLRAKTLLDGYRDQPAADRAAAIDAILAIQAWALAHAERLVELDINPLLVGARHEGAIAADALIVLEEQE